MMTARYLFIWVLGDNHLPTEVYLSAGWRLCDVRRMFLRSEGVFGLETIARCSKTSSAAA